MGRHEHEGRRSSREEPPSDALILAALERAARHRARPTQAVPVWAIYEHLAVPRRSAAARHVRVRLDVLLAAGRLEHSRHHGVPSWQLTSSGIRQLRQARRAGTVAALPDSPQHRAWRDAQIAAAQEIGRFRGSLSEALDEAHSLLGMDVPAHSDAWFELAERLQRACWLVGSASYCLREWDEPQDARPDIETHLEPGEERLAQEVRARRRYRRVGRRNIRLWQERGER
jgi:hypothetical protein